MKYDLDRTGMKKIDKNGKKLHALECGPRCTSWICSNWTAGITAVLSMHTGLCVAHIEAVEEFVKHLRFLSVLKPIEI